MTSKHTKGAWSVIRGQWDDNGDACYSLDGVKDVQVADARLIQAAPELLEALQLILAEYDDRIRSYDDSEGQEAARKAIAYAINGVEHE